jgi:hypothetical protein
LLLPQNWDDIRGNAISHQKAAKNNKMWKLSENERYDKNILSMFQLAGFGIGRTS